MAGYSYTALDPAGKTVRGQLDVGSRGEAYRSLEEKRLTPLQVRSSDERELSPAKTRAAQGAVKLRSAQLILFTEELADLLDAGVQLQQALTIMAERQQF
ncbi:MAG: hypothetical protein ACKVHP_05985 [Verrucomicrobiales bacterium]